MRKRTVLCFTAALLLGLLPLLASAETVLDLSQYSIVHLGDRKLVYQGPGKDYFRDGSAGVGATNDVRVYGTLGDWMMIGYVYSTDNFRVGWVERPTSGMEIISQEDVGELSFEYVVRAVNDDCAMTYDPVFVSVRSLDLEKGDKVTLLCRVTKQWVYVETSIKGKPSRGFLYTDMLGDVPVAADAAPLSPSGAGAKTVMKNMAAKTLEENADTFASAEAPVPLVPTLHPAVFANKFTGGKTIYSVYNRGAKAIDAPVLRLPAGSCRQSGAGCSSA